MKRSIMQYTLFLLAGLLAVVLLAACRPDAPDFTEPAKGEAAVSVTSSSVTKVTETTKPVNSETESETLQTTEPLAESTTAANDETAAETTRSTTAATTARPTETTVQTAAPTTVPETVPVAATVSLAIKCHIATAAGLAGAPADGIILETVTVELDEDKTVFDILNQVSKDEGIVVVSRGSGTSVFIMNIAGLTAVDAKSGWVFSVNGEFVNIGSGTYKLKPGDIIEWHYTMDTGNDL